MEAIIKINPEEFTSKLRGTIRKMLKGKRNAEIIISIHDKPSNKYLHNETPEEYFTRLNEAVKNIEKGSVITLSPESFNEFSRVICE